MDYDYLIIGAGISGAAAGYELSLHGSTAIVEMESHPGYHSTGRSAALYTPNYGPDLVRKINRLSSAFLHSPPTGFTSGTLLTHRGMMTVVFSTDVQAMPTLLGNGGDHVEKLAASEVLALAPFLQTENVHGAVYEAGVYDMDVSALHQGFLAGFKQRGGTLICNAKVNKLVRDDKCWQIICDCANYSADVVVNAAGAWADEVGDLAGAKAIGLQPKRRTAILVDAPAAVSLASVPAIDFYGIDNYIKPEGQQLMVSLGDETPVDPQDIQTDDFEVAMLVDWLERTSRIKIDKVAYKWAGLRNFTASGTPMVGFDPLVDRFFWLAGQGGYGIMLAPALGRATASLITRGCLPEDFIKAGIDSIALGVRQDASADC